MIIMIIWFITIISILIIYWFQYPYVKNKNNEHKYINIFNHMKIPLFAACIFSLIYIISCCTEKTDLAIDLTPLNF